MACCAASHRCISPRGHYTAHSAFLPACTGAAISSHFYLAAGALAAHTPNCASLIGSSAIALATTLEKEGLYRSNNRSEKNCPSGKRTGDDKERMPARLRPHLYRFSMQLLLFDRLPTRVFY